MGLIQLVNATRIKPLHGSAQTERANRTHGWLVPPDNGQPDPYEKHRARLVVAGHARGREDLVDLLQVLGLWEGR
jgi:hypothetical protein